MQIIRWTDFSTDRGSYQVARANFSLARPRTTHSHDYPELFWLERGRAMHLVNGHRQALSVGHAVLMRPSDVHAVRAVDRGGFTYVNVAFHPRVLEHIHQHYFGGSDDWPWAGQLPLTRLLATEDLWWVRRWVERSTPDSDSRLAIESLLLHILDAVRTSPHVGWSGEHPSWLDEAIRGLSDPRELALGVRGLVARCGRCPEHVSRSVRKATGKSATDLVNEMRLDYASKQLRLTDRAIQAIAADCGLTNLSYFYRLFRKRFSTTPRAFRLREQAATRRLA
jgi:AraC family transcriptional regulator, dual regulator of chb operon